MHKSVPPSSHLLHRPICLNRPPLNYSSLRHFSEPRLRRGATPSCQRHLAGLIPRVFLCGFPTPCPVHLHPHPQTHAHIHLSVTLLILRLPFPNNSGASVASCDWCACDYGKIGSRAASASIEAQKYLGGANCRNAECKGTEGQSGTLRLTETLKRTRPPLVLLVPGATGQPLDLLYSPTGRHIGLTSPRSPPPPPSSLLLGLFFFFALSGVWSTQSCI